MRIACWFAGSTVAAGLLALSAHPATKLLIQSIMIQGNLFTAALMSGLFVGMIILSVTAGLPWKTHVARICQGLGAYSFVQVAIEAGHTYYGLTASDRIYVELSHLRIAVYLVCLLYWIVMLWRTAPPVRTMPDLMRRQLFALSGSVEVGLKTLRSWRQP